MSDDPTAKFIDWLAHAEACVAIPEPTAMTLATVDSSGNPSARVVLLKGLSARGFVFYTNLESAKSHDILQNPKVALCFYWGPLNRQVRVQGVAEPVDDAEADAYFSTRPRESQIGSWASAQSRPLEDRKALLKNVETYTQKFTGKPVPRPPFWSGWRVAPYAIEFWQQGDFRLHEREFYLYERGNWTMKKLYP